MELYEIEELIKGTKPNAMKAMIRNAAILNDPNVTDEMRRQALENVKAIAANKPTNEIKEIAMKPADAIAPKKPKKIKSTPEQAIKLAQIQATPNTPPAPVAAVAPKLEYPEGLHLTPLNESGHDEPTMRGIFDGLQPHEKKSIIDWHASNKMKKSVETLYNLFAELKKHI